MDLNELKGRVIKVNLAKPMKGLLSAPGQNRASTLQIAVKRWHDLTLYYYYSLGIGRMATAACQAVG